jgi:Raf kinase inhibitor-like YbhB/YbcL family protein
MTLKLSSAAFADQGEIPSRFTCEGEDVSPALGWSGIPPGTKSLVLIVEDPDAPDPAAPRMVWDHWLLYNLPADAAGLAEAVRLAELPAGTLEGVNSWGRTGYGGPCPPIGRHRYFHRLYALAERLPDLNGPEKAELLRSMAGKVIAQAELIGTYKKRR